MFSQMTKDLALAVNPAALIKRPNDDFSALLSSAVKKNDPKETISNNQGESVKNIFIDTIRNASGGIPPSKTQADFDKEAYNGQMNTVRQMQFSTFKKQNTENGINHKYVYEKAKENNAGNELKNAIIERKNDLTEKKMEFEKSKISFDNKVLSNDHADAKKINEKQIKNDHEIKAASESLSGAIDSQKSLPISGSKKLNTAEKIPEVKKMIHRIKYLSTELVQIRDNQNSKLLINSIKLSFTGFEPYSKKKNSKETKVSYKRSENAWVSAQERLKNAPKDVAEFEKFKITVQMCVNKFNKNNKTSVYKELESILVMKSESHIEFLIDCIYRSIIRYGNWITEFATLLNDISVHSKELKNKIQSAIVTKFLSGTKVSDEWIASYNAIKNRKIVTVDDLDDVNEELQTAERFQGTICLGCSKMLACLYLCKVFLFDEAIKFVKSLVHCNGIFDLEMLCTFLMQAGAELQASKVGCLKDVFSTLKNKKKTLAIRQQFILDEVLEMFERRLQTQNKTTKNPNISIYTIQPRSENSTTMTKNSLYPQRPNKVTTETPGVIQNNSKNVTVLNSKSDEKQNNSVQPSSQSRFYKPPNNQGKAKCDIFGSSKPKPIVKILEPVKEVKEENVFTYEMGRESLIPLLGIFIEQYDTHQLISELKELEVANNMDMFVKISYHYFSEQVSINCVYIGHMYNILFEGGRLIKADFLKGFSGFLTEYNDLVVDVPSLLTFISRSLLPLIINKRISIDDYYGLMKKNKIQDIENVIPDLMKEFEMFTTLTSWLSLWNESDVSKNVNPVHNNEDINVPSVYADSSLFPQYNDAFIDAIKNENKDTKLKDLFNDYCKILHFCCSSCSQDMVDSYLDKLFTEQISFYSIISKSPKKLTILFSQLLNIIKDRSNIPSCLIRCVATKFIRLKLVTKQEIEKTLSDVESTVFEFVIRELKSVVI